MTRPVIHTDRVRLDPLTHEHTELLVELDSDPEVLRFIFGRALTRDEVVDTYLPRRTRPDADARGLGFWVGFAHETDAFLGWWCLSVDDADAGAAELGYRVRRDAWGRGYATEGSRVLLAHAFDTVGLERVWADTMAVNAGSRRVMEKLGLQLVRSYVGDWPHPIEGWEQGEVVYETKRAPRLPRAQ